MLKSIESVLTRVARRRFLSCVIVVVLTVLLRTALLPIFPKHQAGAHDEFSYVFAGETFADGRMATPTHPLWRFFETYQINMQPTYASKYPPGQGAFLALGIFLFGHPWYGVLISVALMCGCICWMLQGWMPPKWALAGGVLATLQFGIAHYWMNSYWGGAVAAIGGILVIGALPRLARDGRASAALAAGIGIAILANTRPFEGLLLVLISSVVFILWTRRRVAVWLRPRVILAIALVLLGNAGLMAYYNFRVTGNAMTLPYSVNQSRYSRAPILWFLPAHPSSPKQYRDESMQRYWEELDFGNYVRVRRNPLLMAFHVSTAVGDLVGPHTGLILAFVAMCAIPLARTRRLRVVFGILAIFLLSIMTLDRYTQAHYLAPAVGAYFVIVMSGFRLLRNVRLGNRPIGRVMVAAIIGFAAAGSVLDIVPLLKRPTETDSTPLEFRAKVASKLNTEPGKHLVLVHYAPGHDYNQELIFNTPDIDAQKIIWAFDFGPTDDRPLLDYYRDRRVWLVQPDGPAPTIEAYSGGK